MIVLAFIGFNKVFSPQHLIWPWPFVLWFLLYLPKRKMLLLGGLWCLVLLLTHLILAKFWDLVALEPLAISLQVLRNLLFIALLVGVLLVRQEELV